MKHGTKAGKKERCLDKTETMARLLYHAIRFPERQKHVNGQGTGGGGTRKRTWGLGAPTRETSPEWS